MTLLEISAFVHLYILKFVNYWERQTKSYGRRKQYLNVICVKMRSRILQKTTPQQYSTNKISNKEEMRLWLKHVKKLNIILWCFFFFKSHSFSLTNITLIQVFNVLSSCLLVFSKGQIKFKEKSISFISYVGYLLSVYLWVGSKLIYCLDSIMQWALHLR